MRVDHLAHIVHGDVALEIDIAGIPIDLDDADMRAEREGTVWRIIVGGVVQERLHAGGRL